MKAEILFYANEEKKNMICKLFHDVERRAGKQCASEFVK